MSTKFPNTHSIPCGLCSVKMKHPLDEIQLPPHELAANPPKMKPFVLLINTRVDAAALQAAWNATPQGAVRERKSSLPMLLGLSQSFSCFASLARFWRPFNTVTSFSQPDASGTVTFVHALSRQKNLRKKERRRNALMKSENSNRAQ